MKPLLDEAFLLLQQYAKDKGMEEYERLALQATINNRNKHMALDIEAFNRLVTEMIESKTSSSADVFEHKLMLISVFASKISDGFGGFISKMDALIQADS